MLSLSLLHTDRKFIGRMLSEAHTLVSENLAAKTHNRMGAAFALVHSHSKINSIVTAL